MEAVRRKHLPVEQPEGRSEDRGTSQTDQEGQQEELPILPHDIGIRLVRAGSGGDHGRKRRLRLAVECTMHPRNHRGADQSGKQKDFEHPELRPPERIPKVGEELLRDRHIRPISRAILARTTGKGKKKGGATLM